MICAACESDPCTCQRVLACPTDWINQTCSSPGCTVVIRTRIGKQPSIPVCRWCINGESHVKRQCGQPQAIGTKAPNLRLVDELVGSMR